MITRIHARNFQGLVDVDLALSQLTLVWGANGSGKSSLLDAILHALTGSAARGCTLPELVRQGTKSAEVTVDVGGRAITRRRVRSGGGEQLVDGVAVPAAEADATAERLTGARRTAIAAALRGGALLEMPPAELQQLLSDLTGASFDAQAIADALGNPVHIAASRAGLPLPKSLPEVPGLCTAAEAKRQAAKRQVTSLEADLARLPVPPAEATTVDVAALRSSLPGLRSRHARALADRAANAAASDATRAERARTLRAQLAELQAVPAGQGAPGRLVEVERVLVGTDREIGRLQGLIGAGVEPPPAPVAGDDQLRGRADDIRRQHAEARQADQSAQLEMDAAEARWKAARADEKALGDETCKCPCPHCAVGKVDAALKAAHAAGEAARAKQATTKRALDEAKARVQLLDAAEARARAIEDAKAAEASVADARGKLAGLEAERTSLAAQVPALREQEEAARRYSDAQRRVQTVTAEIRQLEASPKQVSGDDPATVEAEIARVERLVASVEQLAARRQVEARLVETRQLVADSDAVAQACGPKGVRAQLVAAACAPFLAAANEVLALLSTGWSVEVDGDGELRLLVRHTAPAGEVLLAPAQLSDGERARLHAVLQVAVSRLAGLSMVVLDRTEAIDDRRLVGRLASWCAARGIQVLALSCAPAPEVLPASVAGYVLAEGRVVRTLGAAAVEAAKAA